MAETKTAAAKTVEKEAAKTEVKAAAAKATEKAVEVKEEAKAAKPAAKKTTAKKTTTKAAAEKKPAAAKKAPAKKAEVKTEVNIQFDGKNYTTDDILKIAQDVWKYELGNKAADMKKVELYVKPEEGKVYYVFNGEVTGSFPI